MFRKIVSSLPFSPALVGQLGFYAKRLRKEETTRKLGLIFTALALVVQSFAVFSPPEAANASGYQDCSTNSVIRCGAQSVQELRQKVAQNATGDLQTIYAHYGLSPSVINGATVKIGYDYRNGNVVVDGRTVATGSQSLGRESIYGSHPINIGGRTYYESPNNTAFLSDPIQVMVFFDANGRYIGGVMLACGNPLGGVPTQPPAPPKPKPCVYNGNLPENSPDCKPCPYNGNLWYKDSRCVPPVGKCKYNTAILETSPDCKPCQYNANIWYKDERCQPPCKYNGSLLTNSPDCKPCQYNPSIWYKDNRCKAPVVTCSGLTRSIVDRTHFKLNGKAVAENGAKIKAYKFTVKDASGKVVYSTTVSATAGQASSPQFELPTTGKYTAYLSVDTSTGSVTSPNCATALEVVAPAVCPLNPAYPVTDKENCKPCDGDHTIWYKDAECMPSIQLSKSVSNMSQGNKDATTVTAKAEDTIQYTVTVKNSGKMPATQDIVDKLADSLEYTTVVDTGGGTFDKDAGTLAWRNVTVKAGETQSRTFVVRILKTIPSTNASANAPTSYDCVLSNTFGNATNIRVDCPIEKVIVEQTVSELPHTGPSENMIFAGILLAVVTFFYARSRQLGKEVRLVRKNVNAGAI